MGYQEVDDRADDEGPVPAKVGVGDVSAEDWSHPHCAHPVGDIVGGGDGPHVDLVGQIED